MTFSTNGPSSTAKSPPIGVGIIAIVVWISGFIGLFNTGRLFWQLIRNDPAVDAAGGAGVYIAAIIVSFLINVAIISLAGALGRGSNLARVVISIFVVLHLISATALVIRSTDTISLTAGWIAIALNVLALILMWVTGRAFFRKEPEPFT